MKYFQYVKYVLIHKWFVFIGCVKLGCGSTFLMPLLFRGIVHDWSKFLPLEFFPYVEYFYGNSSSNHSFKLAWLRHQKRNKHHWQWWLLQNDEDGLEAFDMPDLYILEMVADWYGAGRAISGREVISPWYEKNKDKILLSARTRKVLENVIRNFDAL